ncbi:TetR family transcriptional regulator [Vibrio alfacsensis]|uniref:TetR family transcriptional regulator n=1 Tax=Vibrio alfacsensis TaxID=1074311 RepID=UPI00406843CD
MARRTQEDTQITINTILDVATEQLITLGYERMSYTTLSEQTGISRTGICHHFPRKADLACALQGRFLKRIVDKLDLNGSEESFATSWEIALSDAEFLAIWRLAVQMTVCDHHPAYLHELHVQIESIACAKLGQPCQHTIEWLIGKTLLSLQTYQ